MRRHNQLLPDRVGQVFAALVLLCLLAAPLHAQSNRPLRVVSLTAPAAELMYALGAQDELVGVSDSCVFPERIMNDRKSGRIRVVGDFMTIDSSVVESLKPDVIITGTSFQESLAKTLQAKGYRVLHMDPKSLNDIFSSFEAIGTAIGKEQRAKKYAERLRSEAQSIQAKTRTLMPVRVYMEINHMGPWTSGGESYINDVIRIAGGRNIFEDVPGDAFQTTNAEVVRRNPEVILSPIWIGATVGGITGITTIAEIDARDGFKNIAAVRNSRVLYYDSALLKQGGPREVLAIRKLAHLLHPREFPDPPGTIPWELGRVE